MWYDIFPSAFGEILVVGDDQAIEILNFQKSTSPHPVDPAWRRDAAPFTRVKEELQAYFAGELQDFSFPVAPRGTEFQRQVWQALREIPYGKLATYRDIAQRIGRPNAVRAVGAANGANPVAVVVPCHRVIGSNGTLTGYAGGLEIKERLLQLEGSLMI